MSKMAGLRQTKLRTSWIAALAVLLLIWTIWSLDLHSYITSRASDTDSSQTSLTIPAQEVYTEDARAGLNPPSGGFDHDLASPDESSDRFESSPMPTDLFADVTIASTATPSTSTSSAPYSSTAASSIASNTTISDRPLILYAFFETPLARSNFEFFLAHGLHGAADFIFILNGETNASEIIPNEPNIKVIRRENDCYDLGAFAEVLLTDDLYKKYNKFITLNASVRGPFLPYWSNGCWSDMYLSKVTEEVKLVGMTINCQPFLPPHIQSMIWATDRIGLEILLHPSDSQIEKLKASLPEYNPAGPVPAMEFPGINSCPHEYWKAVAIEVYSTPLIRAAGYEVDAIMTAYHQKDRADYEGETCYEAGDVLFPGAYYGVTLHPFDTVFMKTNRGNDPLTLERLSEWTTGRKYSSYDYCHAS